MEGACRNEFVVELSNARQLFSEIDNCNPILENVRKGCYHDHHYKAFTNCCNEIDNHSLSEKSKQHEKESLSESSRRSAASARAGPAWGKSR
jgi:hypothetical protein